MGMKPEKVTEIKETLKKVKGTPAIEIALMILEEIERLQAENARLRATVKRLTVALLGKAIEEAMDERGNEG